MNLLTFHDYPYILNQTIDDLESLRRGHPSLVKGETI